MVAVKMACVFVFSFACALAMEAILARSGDRGAIGLLSSPAPFLIGSLIGAAIVPFALGSAMPLAIWWQLRFRRSALMPMLLLWSLLIALLFWLQYYGRSG